MAIFRGLDRRSIDGAASLCLDVTANQEAVEEAFERIGELPSIPRISRDVKLGELKAKCDQSDSKYTTRIPSAVGDSIAKPPKGGSE